MRHDVLQPRGRCARGRWPTLLPGLLAGSLFIAAGEPPALAERLDLGVRSFHEATFDATVLEPVVAEPPPAEAERADGTLEESETDATDAADASLTDTAENAPDAAVADNDSPADADEPNTDLVAEAETSDSAESDDPADVTDVADQVDPTDRVDPADVEVAAFGDLPEPQPPTLLWRFKTLFARKDEVGGQPDTVEELEERLSHIPLIRTPRVERHIRYFQTSKRDHFDQWLARLNHYKPLVEKIFAQFQLPADLIFLSLVESGFNPKAYSRARAAGPWQFMKATARLYGLRVDEYVDERRDPIKSTVAAARYLRDLYDLFGTWPLAMAAYNAGERKILRALRKARAETFWEIAQTKFIRRETREYVPRFMAAAIIAKNPDQYGFEPAAPPAHEFEEIVVSRPLHLRAIAAAAGLPYEELRRLNPELRRDVTPPGDPAYHLKVPAGSRGAVEQALASVKTWTKPVVLAKARTIRPNRNGLYRVRMGDSLSAIAKRFRITVEELKARNKLAGRSIKVGDLLLVGR